jgi:hypothetical protein
MQYGVVLPFTLVQPLSTPGLLHVPNLPLQLSNLSSVEGITILRLIANVGAGYSAGVYLTETGDDTQAADTKPQSPSLEDVYKTPPLDQYPAGWDGTTPPAEGWIRPHPDGNWYNPETKDSISPPGDHKGHGEHIDWIKKGVEKGAWWFSDGRIKVKP